MHVLSSENGDRHKTDKMAALNLFIILPVIELSELNNPAKDWMSMHFSFIILYNNNPFLNGHVTWILVVFLTAS